MKPRNAALTAVVITSAVFAQKEAEARECKEQRCAAETFARVPEQPHSHDEPPSLESTDERVYVSLSPLTSVTVGSERYREILGTCPELLIKIDASGKYFYVISGKEVC
jgi:hypothetical protein